MAASSVFYIHVGLYYFELFVQIHCVTHGFKRKSACQLGPNSGNMSSCEDQDQIKLLNNLKSICSEKIN